MKLVKGTVVSVNPNSFYRPEVGTIQTIRSYGECIDYIIKDDDGNLIAINEDEGSASIIKINPFEDKT